MHELANPSSEMFCMKCVSAYRLTFMSEWKSNSNTTLCSINFIMLIVNVLQNKFKVENFVIDVEKLPEHFPGGYWRYVFQQFVKNELVLEFLIDTEIQ